MDKIEKYCRENKMRFDTLQPDSGLWVDISTELEKDVLSLNQRKFTGLKWAIMIVALCSLGLTGIWIYQHQSMLFDQQPVSSLEKGMNFPDISLRSPQGELVSLNSLKGKIVLVEFWASYSKVCTNENCFYFQPIYHEYKDRGFEVFGVSIDTSAVEWIAGIERDGLPWIQVADVNGPSEDLKKLYDADRLPTTYLLDENGTIIDININAANLRAKLNELLAFNQL